MLLDFLTFINKNSLFEKKDSVLLAISGGKDSMVMVDLMVKAGFSQITVAHCNFKLRGKDSDRDEIFVKEYCQNNGLACFTVQFETVIEAENKRISIEMAARDLRYAWFKEIMLENNIKYLATAHHLNDNIETLLLGFTKGMGVTGLSGIPEFKNKIIRPLLNFTREDIDAYAKENTLDWREDKTNAESNYSRNKIRNLVIPVLREINPGLEKTFHTNLKRFKALSEIFQEQLSEFKKECVIEKEDTIIVNSNGWTKKPGYELIIEEYLRCYGFNFDQVQSIMNISTSGKSVFSEHYELLVDRERWIISKTNNLMTYESIPGIGKYKFEYLEICISEVSSLPNDFKESKNIYIDFEKIKWPLNIRNWKQGDKIQPLGMKGNKLVSDILINSKMSLIDKKKQLVLVDKNEIIWLMNVRVSEKYKLTNNTKRILEIETIVI